MDITHKSVVEHIIVRQAEPARIRHWFRMAWKDFRRAPADCLFYGALFVLMGYLLVGYVGEAPELVVTLATIFVLGGPFLALGLYDIANQVEAFDGNGRVTLRHSLTSWRVNMPAFSLYAVLLTVLVFAWFRVSLLMFALFYDTASLPSLGDLVAQSFSAENVLFLLAYFGSGLLFAMTVFVCSVVSLPMMLDKEVDTITAMIASVQVVQRNLLTMLAWAAIIVVLTLAGFATGFVGLIVIMPMIGLATWHAYRDLISYER